MSDLFKGLFGLALIMGSLTVVGYGLHWCGETAEVAQKELGPSALLQKYTWLKEAHAQLDKKQADIKVYDARFSALKEQYNNVPRSKWAREDRDQSNMWEAEEAGIIASYNDLAAQYNAKMSEVNWKFTNVGDLPQGATEPLPREYAPYAVK
ncbi:MAG: hypothetical protein KGH64_04330 [Candidatus Micrarchaeota archaeon]|nr:hypothetical protein [Candidatus Micrarchaeota archaeon]